jgi:hypothetical protein
MKYPATRKEAKESNEAHYFTGKPCKFNHISKRFVFNGVCLKCHSERSNKTYHKENGKEKQRTETIRETKRRWRQNNKGVVNSWTAMRYANKKQRTPPWLTEKDVERIKCYYQVAAMYTKEGLGMWSVDHLVPLRGENVSGLHVPNNLTVITQVKNSSKSNNWDWNNQTGY